MNKEQFHKEIDRRCEENPKLGSLLTLMANITQTIDIAHQLAELIKRGQGGRETALVVTKLQEALMWAEEISFEEKEEFDAKQGIV